MKTSFLHHQIQSHLHRTRQKLSRYPLQAEQLFTTINNALSPSELEVSTLLACISLHNFAFYRFNDVNIRNKKAVLKLGNTLGLHHLDNNICADNDKLTSIEVRSNQRQHNYIPYSNRKLGWHTDGYYNKPGHQINGFILHCAQPAKHGGDSLLMDIDIAFILLHNENPDFITALMHPNAMTIPANILNGEVIREEQSGPVFSFSAEGNLHMRYSARTRNIQWRDTPITQVAVDFLKTLWDEDSPYILKYRFKSGEGLVCNNILHCRTTFEDSEREDEKRLLYRGRYYDRIKST